MVWKIGRAAGIDVYVHATFFLLIAFVAITYWLEQSSVAAPTAAATAASFIRPWIPVHLRSDNGSEFANQQIRTCTNKLG